MHEQVVAEAGGERQRLDEGAMVVWDRLGEFARQAGVVESEQRPGRRHAVGTQGGVAAIVEPHPTEFIRCGEEAGEERIVIAAQADDVVVAGRHPQQPRDDAGGIRSAIDIVADVDDAVVVDRALHEVVRDRLMDGRQHVVAAVNVADGIETHAVGST